MSVAKNYYLPCVGRSFRYDGGPDRDKCFRRIREKWIGFGSYRLVSTLRFDARERGQYTSICDDEPLAGGSIYARRSPKAPNFFVEGKGPGGSAAVAKRQITYDMALGESGQAALDAYPGSEPSYNNEAHTLGCSYLDGTLKLYATHAIQPFEPEVPSWLRGRRAWAT